MPIAVMIGEIDIVRDNISTRILAQLGYQTTYPNKGPSLPSKTLLQCRKLMS